MSRREARSATKYVQHMDRPRWRNYVILKSFFGSRVVVLGYACFPPRQLDAIHHQNFTLRAPRLVNWMEVFTAEF